MIIVSHLLYYERPYLDEWINFHKKQGFTTFYIYLKYGQLTHGSIIPQNDKIYNDLVEKYKSKNVHFIHIKSVPLIHINHFFRNYAKNHINQWCAILDIDEFLHCPVNSLNIKKLVNGYNKKNINAILVNWHCYGSNGVIENPLYEVVNKFTKPTNRFHEINCYGKSFIKIIPDLVKKYIDNTNNHRIMIIKKYYTSNGIPLSKHNQQNYNKYIYLKKQFLKEYYNKTPLNVRFNIDFMWVYPEKNPKLIINHYITRSLNEYQEKISINKNKTDRYNLKFFNYINNI